MWNFYVLKWANSCPILKSFEQFSRASKHNNPVTRLSPCSQVLKVPHLVTFTPLPPFFWSQDKFQGNVARSESFLGWATWTMSTPSRRRSQTSQRKSVWTAVSTPGETYPPPYLSDPYYNYTLFLRANASNSGEEYCFKNEQSSGSLECQVRIQFNYFKTGVLCFL